MAVFVLVAVVILFSGWWIFLRSKKNGRYPPGPKGIPFFGNALQLELKRFASQLAEIGKEYDDAYTVQIFDKKVVILNSYELIKEVMMSSKYAEVVSGRPPSFLGEYVARKDEILQTYSEEWAALRKLVFRGLKTYGTHMAEVEDLVQEELKHLVSRIQSEAGKAVDPKDYISGYITSIIMMLLTGQHLQHDDPLLQICTSLAEDSDQMSNPLAAAVMAALPWLRHIPLGYGKLYQRIVKKWSHLKDTVYQDRKNNKDRKPCFLDFMFEEKSKGHVTQESVSSVFLDMIAAGSGTSQGAIYSMLLILASRPDVQKKIQNEIDQEIGRSRLPCAEDKHRMPYTQAFLWESFRLLTPAPFTVPHCTMDDVQIRDYLLPKDTVVFYNIWNVLHDETFWKDPWKFDPSRFLDDAGDLLPPEDEKRHRMIAFGVGKRLCIGEVLARLRIFLACAVILQNFTLLPDPECPLPDPDPRTFDVCILLSAPRYKVIFKPRVPA